MVKMKPYYKSFILIFTLIILGSGLLIGGFYAGTKYRSYQLKTYTDGFYDFTFKYPADWFIDKNENVAGEIKIGDDKEYLISVRVHPRGDKEYIEKIWKTQNCVECDYDVATVPYTDIKTVTVGQNNFYWNKDGSGDVHAFITNPSKDKTIEFYTWRPNLEKELDKVLINFSFVK